MVLTQLLRSLQCDNGPCRNCDVHINMSICAALILILIATVLQLQKLGNNSFWATDSFVKQSRCMPPSSGPSSYFCASTSSAVKPRGSSVLTASMGDTGHLALCSSGKYPPSPRLPPFCHHCCPLLATTAPPKQTA